VIERSHCSCRRRPGRPSFVVSLVMLSFVLAGCGAGKQLAGIDRESSHTKGMHTMEPDILPMDGFALMGTATRITTGNESIGQWPATSGFTLDDSAPSFEKYPPAEDTVSPVLIHIPIQGAQGK
jgi:hypothetical protein